MKYKLLSDWNGIAKGKIVNFKDSSSYYTFTSYSNRPIILLLAEIEVSPNWSPLVLTTEDGVDIYYREYHWLVYSSGFKIDGGKDRPYSTITYSKKEARYRVMGQEVICFSTEQKAQEYLDSIHNLVRSIVDPLISHSYKTMDFGSYIGEYSYGGTLRENKKYWEIVKIDSSFGQDSIRIVKRLNDNRLFGVKGVINILGAKRIIRRFEEHGDELVVFLEPISHDTYSGDNRILLRNIEVNKEVITNKGNINDYQCLSINDLKDIIDDIGEENKIELIRIVEKRYKND